MLIAAGLGFCALARGASAQVAPRDTLAADTAALPLAPLEVTVFGPTLTQREAPYAVTVSTAAAGLDAAPGLSLDGPLRAIPGVQVDNRFNYALGERISVRGFGARAQFGVRGVAVLLDGVPLTLPDGQSALGLVDPAFLGRVEAVRGPASALFGNAAGGAILLRSEPIPTGGALTRARLLGGSHDFLRAEASAGWGEAERGVRVDASWLSFGGFRAHSEADVAHGLARAELPVGPGALQVSLAGVRYDAQNPGSLSDSLLRADRTQAFATNVRHRTGEDASQLQLSGRWTGPVGAADAELALWGHVRDVENPIPFRIIALDRAVTGARAAVSGDAAERGGVSALEWQLGGEVSRQADDRRNFVNEDGARGALVLSQDETVTSAAVFARALFRLTPRLRALAGLRHDRHSFEAEDRLVSALNPDESGRRTLDAWSPTVGASFDAATSLTLYANVATAFETPTTSELANRPDGAGGFNPFLEPQRTLSFELGGKGAVGPLGYELTAYRARVEDALIPFEVPALPGRQFFRNAGSAIHQGVESTLTAMRGPWLARLAYTYTDARFDEYVVDDEALDGNRIPGVAPHRVEAALEREVLGGSLALDAQYVSDTPVNDANTATSPAYFVADLRALAPPLETGLASVAPFLSVQNLFDAEYNTSVVVNAFGRRFFEPGPPRSFFVGLRAALR